MVTVFDCTKGWFSVAELMDYNEGRLREYYRVELDRGLCNCKKLQAFHIPCSHVIVACSKARHDSSNLLFVVYKVINLRNVYNNNFLVVAKEDYWPTYQWNIVWHNENMRTKKKGLLNSMRIRTKMDTTNKMVRLCSSCCQLEHNRTNCPNVGASSTT